MSRLYPVLHCTHDRPEFGCGGCIARLSEARAAAELEAAPTRRVTMRWSLAHRGEITVDAKVADGDEDHVASRVSEIFDGEIAAALQDANVDILMAVDLDDFTVGPKVEPANPNQLTLLEATS